MRILTSLAHCQAVRIAAPMALVLLSPAVAVYAVHPKVSFDLGYVVECRDVTPQAFAMLHPDEKVIEANLRVSVRLERGDEKDIDQLQFEIVSPAERLRIVDFLPRTRLEPEAADNIEVVNTQETIRSLGASLGTTVSINGGNGNAHGSVLATALPAANANATHRNELKETTKKIPPGRAIVTSGTLENEHGVFFKLKRSASGSFEGIKPLSFRFVAASDWRGDWLVMSCQARGTVHRYFFKSLEEIGSTKAFLALHLAGDGMAERAALELAEAQEQYFAVKPPEGRYDLIITTLATEARPWRAASHTHNIAAAVKTPVTCLKPAVKGSVFRFAASEKKQSCETCEWLKQTLDRVARFSAAPGWHVDAAGMDRD